MQYENGDKITPIVSVEIELKDILIPSIPCKPVELNRTYDLRTDTEELKVYIDRLENELTKEVSYEVFVNDFILPREIANSSFLMQKRLFRLRAKSKP